LSYDESLLLGAHWIMSHYGYRWSDLYSEDFPSSVYFGLIDLIGYEASLKSKPMGSNTSKKKGKK
jgi:hypothetical protein